MQPLAAATTTLAMLALAMVHVYWALGGLWPGRNNRDLATRVIGNERMPSTLACLTVSLGLTAAAAVIAIGGRLVQAPAPALPTLVGAWAVCAAFTVRGLAGLFAERIDPRVLGTPFARLNRQFYSPFCLALAALCAVSIA